MRSDDFFYFIMWYDNKNNYRIWLLINIMPPKYRALKSGFHAFVVQWHRDTSGDTFWLSWIYFLVHAIFVASKLWIWQHFKETQSKPANFWISKTFVHGFLLLSNWKHLKFHGFLLCCQIMSRITPFFGPILCRESRCFGDTFQP